MNTTEITQKYGKVSSCGYEQNYGYLLLASNGYGLFEYEIDYGGLAITDSQKLFKIYNQQFDYYIDILFMSADAFYVNLWS